MTTDYRDLITRMAKELDNYRQLLLDDRTVTHRLSDEARAALADEPAVPQGREPAAVTGQPSDGEVAELVAWLRSNALTVKKASGNPANGARQRMNHAAELLQRLSPPQPVLVSERLPGPEDCDAAGRCWWGRSESHDWSADWTLATPEAIAEFCEFSPRTTWLPAHALPLPEVGE